MSDLKRVLITDRFSPEALLLLQNPRSPIEVVRSKSFYPTAAELDGVHGLVIRSRTQVDEQLLSQAKALQVVVTATSGFDHIDLPACEKWGITVMHTPWSNVNTTAQHTFALVLACTQKILTGHAQVKAGTWEKSTTQSFELQGRTYGIVGLGRIGSKVAELARGFGMKVMAYDPYADDKDFETAQAERVALEELMKSCDVMSLHVPRTRETYRMISRSNLEYIHRGMILVNTCRGGVIAEQDLTEALEKGWVGAAGLDVFEKEPLPRNSPLLKLPNVICTPHVGANSKESFANASEQAALQVLNFFRDGSTTDTLPPKAPWYGLEPKF